MATLEATGNCFEHHARMLLDYEVIGFTLVHGEISGQMTLKGIRIGHGWLEKEGIVYDFSNGKSIRLPIEVYYKLGSIIDEPGKLHKYTRTEMCSMLIKHENWGCWELTCEL